MNVYSVFKELVGRFCLTPLNSTKRGANLNPLLKKISEILFSAFFRQQKSACPTCFEVGQAQKKNPTEFALSGVNKNSCEVA